MAPPAAAAAAASASPAGAPAESADGAETAEPLADIPSGARENGQRFGVRFRRGSRGGLRAGEVPLIGVVQMDSPPESIPVEVVAVEGGEPAEAAGRKPARPKRAPRKKAATATAAKAVQPAKAEPPGDGAGAAPAPPVKRSRPRARKKVE